MGWVTPLGHDLEGVWRRLLAGEWEVEVDTLRLGDQKWERPAGNVTWAVCRVLPLDSVEFDALTR